MPYAKNPYQHHRTQRTKDIRSLGICIDIYGNCCESQKNKKQT